MLWPSTILVFLMMPKSRLAKPSARRVLRPPLPARYPAVNGAKNGLGCLASRAVLTAFHKSMMFMPDRSAVAIWFWRIALPTSESIPCNTPAGSRPLSTVNGVPLCSAKRRWLAGRPGNARPAPLLAEERQLVNRVSAEAERAVITGTRAIGVTVERVRPGDTRTFHALSCWQQSKPSGSTRPRREANGKSGERRLRNISGRTFRMKRCE